MGALMTGLLQIETDSSFPIASRVVQSQFVSLEEAERDAIHICYRSLTKQTLVRTLVTLFLLFVMGYNAVNARYRYGHRVQGGGYCSTGHLCCGPRIYRL